MILNELIDKMSKYDVGENINKDVVIESASNSEWYIEDIAVSDTTIYIKLSALSSKDIFRDGEE